MPDLRHTIQVEHVTDNRRDASGVGLLIIGSETALTPPGEILLFSRAFSHKLGIARPSDAGLFIVIFNFSSSSSDHRYHHLHRLSSLDEDVSSGSRRLRHPGRELYKVLHSE